MPDSHLLVKREGSGGPGSVVGQQRTVCQRCTLAITLVNTVHIPPVHGPRAACSAHSLINLRLFFHQRRAVLSTGSSLLPAPGPWAGLSHTRVNNGERNTNPGLTTVRGTQPGYSRRTTTRVYSRRTTTRVINVVHHTTRVINVVHHTTRVCTVGGPPPGYVR